MKKTINIAQIGCGYWGPNLLRNFYHVKGCKVSHVAEPSKDRRSFINSNYPDVSTELTFDHLLRERAIDAIVIATPAKLHFNQAKSALLAGKHVLVEKPMATKLSEVQELSDIAQDSGLTLMSGHTFLYNDAVLFLKKEIETGNLGEIRYLYSQRLNLGRIRSDVDALWNFAPHDISIIQFLLGDIEPIEIKSFGMDFIQKGIDDVVFLNLRYENVLANIHVSWLDPLKSRKVVVAGSKKMIVYDDIAEDKIIIYDKGIDKFSNLGENMDFDTPRPTSFRYRSGDIWIPKIEYNEPLYTEAKHFVECIRSGNEPLSGPTHSKGVIRILEQASKE
jgi:predicted dehydrogenase